MNLKTPLDLIRVVFLFEYNGREFCGSQKQPKQRSIQLCMEEAFESLGLKLHGPMTFAGRTDAGVHAKGQVGHVDVSRQEFERLKSPLSALNTVLPESIAIRQLQTTELTMPIESQFHATISAERRWYRYRIVSQPHRTVWSGENTLWAPQALDLNAMQMAADYLVGTHDFTSFQSTKKIEVDPVCTVYQAQWMQENTEQGALLSFDIIANRFVYRMVRRLVGTMLKIGVGKLSSESVSEPSAKQYDSEAILEMLTACDHAHPLASAAPAKGLTLMAVYYPPPWDFFCEDVYVKNLINVGVLSRQNQGIINS